MRRQKRHSVTFSMDDVRALVLIAQNTMPQLAQAIQNEHDAPVIAAYMKAKTVETYLRGGDRVSIRVEFD